MKERCFVQTNAEDGDDTNEQLFAVNDDGNFVQKLMLCANELYGPDITQLVHEWQFKDLLEKRAAGRDEQGRILASMEIMRAVIADAFSIFLGLLLNEMTNEGKLECAYDDAKNDFVFSLAKNDSAAVTAD